MVAEDQWSGPEVWVWQQVRAGQIADFSAREVKQEESLEAAAGEAWQGARKLRSDFLKQILLRQPHCAEIPAEGVRIRGAWLIDGVALEHGRLGRQLWLENCHVNGPAKLNGLQIDGWLSLEGSSFSSQGTTANSVDLVGATVKGHLSLERTTFEGNLDMNGVNVTQSIFMGGGSRFKNVELAAAKVGGQLDLTGATFDGQLDLQSVDVEQHVLMRDSIFKQRVRLTFARCTRNINLSNSEFTELDLSGARVGGELRLGSNKHPRTRWRKDTSRLNIRNAHVGALQDRIDEATEQHEKRSCWVTFPTHRPQWEDAWPAQLLLEGFTYDRLGGFGGRPERADEVPHATNVDMQDRHVQWYVEWLARDTSYSPQPYQHLAGAFRAAGDPTKANHILYESRRRAQAEAWRRGEFVRWLGSCFLNWTIGYGLGTRYFRALGWVIAFTSLGGGILHYWGLPNDGLGDLAARLFYSLDQLLPIVEFEKYDKVMLRGGVAYYFYVQKLVGWALGSFLVAGLTGLTQKQ